MNKGWKKLGTLGLIVAWIMVFTMPMAHAYIDPSATTYLIQAIAGIVIAAGSVAVVFWRRAKNRIRDKVGIDLDKNKETEEEVVAVNPEENGK